MKFIVGLGENKNIVEAVRCFKEEYDVDVSFSDREEDLVNGILDENIDGVIRGSLPAKSLISDLKSCYPDCSVNRCTFINSGGFEFLISPVGIDEGLSLDDRLTLAKDCVDFIVRLGMTPRIAVLASGRRDDYNRNPSVDSSLDDSEVLSSMLSSVFPDFFVGNYYILVEKAVSDGCNILLAPDGVIGNILFRSLVLVSGWESMGAVTLGIPEVYIDTSRDQSVEGYFRSLVLAYNLCKNSK